MRDTACVLVVGMPIHRYNNRCLRARHDTHDNCCWHQFNITCTTRLLVYLSVSARDRLGMTTTIVVYAHARDVGMSIHRRNNSNGRTKLSWLGTMTVLECRFIRSTGSIPDCSNRYHHLQTLGHHLVGCHRHLGTLWRLPSCSMGVAILDQRISILNGGSHIESKNI